MYEWPFEGTNFGCSKMVLMVPCSLCALHWIGILANDVHQVFCVKDMSSKHKKNLEDKEKPWEPKCHIVPPGKRKIMGVENKTDQS
ncbi:hypothetical protein Q6247_25620, partial [Klebsiella pneumoniae]